jgi:hypothetical protein
MRDMLDGFIFSPTSSVLQWFAIGYDHYRESSGVTLRLCATSEKQPHAKAQRRKVHMQLQTAIVCLE